MPLPVELTSSLATLPDRFEALLALVPEGRLNWTPESWDAVPGEMFSALGQACHLRDIEVQGYHIRIRRMLEEAEPELDSLDSYELADVNDYASADLAEALAGFRTARQATLALVAGLSDEDLAREGSFAEYGRLSLRGLLHLLCSHDEQHLAVLHWLLTKMSCAR